MTRLPRLVPLLLLALLAMLSACSDAPDVVADNGAVVQPADARQLLEDGATAVDVRTPEEFDAGHVAGAVNIDLQSVDFMDELEDLDVDGPYVVYCASGRRSATAVEHMMDMGFTDVADGGGFDGLDSVGVPTE